MCIHLLEAPWRLCHTSPFGQASRTLAAGNCLVLTYIVGAASLFGVMGLQISGYDGEWVRVHSIAWVFILCVGQSIE